MKFDAARSRSWLLAALGAGTPMQPRSRLVCAFLIFLVSFLTKSLHAGDLAPLMHTRAQPFIGLTDDHDRRAISIVDGHGILIPDNQKPSNTGLLVTAPGYSIYLSAIYALLGRSFFTVQLIQNAVNSISPVLIFLGGGALVSWRAGVVAGFLSAVSHHLSYYSNLVLPDSLCAVPILIGLYLLIRAEYGRQNPFWASALAGIGIGVSAWLRPNVLLLGPFLGLLLAAVSVRRRRFLMRATIIGLVPFLVIAPITIRNYRIYGEFVPVTINLGIVLWEGIGEASGDRFGAVAKDEQVAEQEAILYNNPSYGGWWASPDGIKRDHDRTRKSLAMIARHPLWYSGVMLERMGDMLKYSAYAPLVFRKSDARLIGPESKGEASTESPDPQAETINHQALAVGESISALRPLVRAAQRVAKETALIFILAGCAVMFALSWRKALFLLMVPFYYLLFQAAVHTEFRYALAMHYFLFVFAASVWVIAAAATSDGVKKLVTRHGSRHQAHTGQ